MRTIVAVTGASGAAYAHSLLRHLRGDADLIITRDAELVIREELGLEPEAFRKLAAATYAADDLGALPASGSSRFDAMVIVPCSGTTVAKIAHGILDNLVTRAAAVCLKERRKLILVPRETPLSTIQLENLLKVAQAGAVVLPAMLGFYHRPQGVQDLVDFVVARILDHLGVEHAIEARWKGIDRGA